MALSIKEDPKQDYGMLHNVVQFCGRLALEPRTTKLDCISNATKELLQERRALRLNRNATHMERLVNASCRRTLQADLQRYRRKKLRKQHADNLV